MESEHQKIHINTFIKGAALDTDPEISATTPSNGLYIDGRNVRPVSNDGKSGAAHKIQGEQLNFPNNTGFTGYTCIGACTVNFKIFEVWVDNLGIGPNIIRIDGVTVLQSTLLGYSINFPLQIDHNDSQEITEVFLTDNNIPPSIFDVNDMLTSLTSDPDKYFINFDPLLYQINLQSPLDIPVFVELKNVGGGGGLPVGQYQYEMRYSNDEGDLTQWSQATPPIPVVESLSQQSVIFPWVKTFGGDPNPTSVTGFAIHLRFRVTNIYNYKYIEIKRLAYNQGAGVTFSPNGVIVAKIGISPGEISVREYFDPNESNVNIALSETDETQQLAEIQSAKSIRYFDRRVILMNVQLASKESNLIFLDINTKQGFPVIEKLFRAGHKDPYNHTYRRNWMRGERESFAVVCYDGVGTAGFATKIPQLQDFQFPNRRDTISSETSDFSLYGTARAADTTVTGVSQTHEVFDLVGSMRKGQIDHDKALGDFKNIIRSGHIAGLTGTKNMLGTDNVNEEVTETVGEVKNHGAHVDLIRDVSPAYHPYHPVKQNDPNVTGHNYIVNPGVYKKTTTPGIHGGETAYEPFGFAPDYYAMGLCVAGVSNFPKWAKAFSVVKSGSAKKVVCQGLGYYQIDPAVFNLVGNTSLATKNQNGVWFHSPDIENGMVSSDVLNDIIDNPQNYELQFVSPLGFFSEVYGYDHYIPDADRDRLVDMVSYARMLRDNPNDWRINPDEDASMGIDGGDGFRYVAYEKWRNTGQTPGSFGGNGNKVFDIESVNRISEGRGNYLFIETFDQIYGSGSTGGTSDRNFDDQGLKDWTEPVYMINIVRTGADVVDKNIEGFKQTTHYQKLESIIGKGNGLPNQKYLLVDERWEDCIPAPQPTMFGAGTPRFCFIKKTNGTVDRWVNTTYMTPAAAGLIAANILALGFDTVGGVIVKGVYTHENILNQNRFYNLVFSDPNFIPQQGELIMVRYDNTAPIRVFGGDTYISESIFAPIDRDSNAQKFTVNPIADSKQFALGVGLPFFAYKMNVRHYVIKDSSASVNVIQDRIRPFLAYLRQLCVMYTCETRCGLHLAYNRDYPEQFFPLVNYVMRPNHWSDSKSINDNGIYKQYGIDYGEDEINNWRYGGFRFLPQVNSDYSCEPPIKFFSRPEYGFVERTKFSTRIMWSLPRTLEAQSSPSLKTFPANNSFDIDDGQGEIKRAWDATTARGENLYAITNKGICLLLTKKNILSDLNSGDVGYMASDSFVKQQMWLNKDIGMMDEWWRSAAEGFVPVEQESGTATRVEAIFFTNNESSFMFSENVAKDIGRLDYYTKLYNEGIANVLPGYQTPVTAVYNVYYQEYWLYIGGTVNNMYVFGKENMAYFGTFDYKFDKFAVSAMDTYGVRNLENYILNQGFVINGAPIEYELLVAAAPEQMWEKEFIRLRVNSPEDQRPTKIEFYKERNGVVQCSMDPTIPSQGALYTKNYRGWEQMISRINSSVNPKRPRLQNRILFFKIFHNLPSDFRVIDTALLYKKIKG